MTETWENFVHSVNGQVVFFLVNSAFAGITPLHNRPHLLIVRFRPRRGELLTASEMLSLTHECEDLVEKIVSRPTDALYVGRITASGVVSLHFYTSNPVKACELLENSRDLRQIAEFQFESREDAGWKFYQTSLLPDDWIRNQIENEKVRHTLRRQGDDGVATREVEHYARFATFQACEQFQKFLLIRSYLTAIPDYQADEELPFLLRFSMMQSPNEIDQETWELSQKALELGGSYSGWQTAVVKDDDTSKAGPWSFQKLLNRFNPFGGNK